MKRTISLRVDDGLVNQLDQYAHRNGWAGAQAGLRGGDHKGKDTGRSALMVHLIESLTENRMVITPRAGANPFPANERLPGESLDFPALIWLAPESRKGWYIEERVGIGIYNPTKDKA